MTGNSLVQRGDALCDAKYPTIWNVKLSLNLAIDKYK